MKLSEAIRLGAMLRPGSFCGPGITSSCALQAAYEAVTGTHEQGTDQKAWVFVYAVWPWTTRQAVCPACGACNDWLRIPRIIAIHLNDRHQWTRERIADWVATIEPKDPEPMPEPEPMPAQEPTHV